MTVEPPEVILILHKDGTLELPKIEKIDQAAQQLVDAAHVAWVKAESERTDEIHRLRTIIKHEDAWGDVSPLLEDNDNLREENERLRQMVRDQHSLSDMAEAGLMADAVSEVKAWKKCAETIALVLSGGSSYDGTPEALPPLTMRHINRLFQKGEERYNRGYEAGRAGVESALNRALARVDRLKKELMVAAFEPGRLQQLLEQADDLLDEVGTTSDVDTIYDLTIKARVLIEKALAGSEE